MKLKIIFCLYVHIVCASELSENLALFASSLQTLNDELLHKSALLAPIPQEYREMVWEYYLENGRKKYGLVSDPLDWKYFEGVVEALGKKIGFEDVNQRLLRELHVPDINEFGVEATHREGSLSYYFFTARDHSEKNFFGGKENPLVGSVNINWYHYYLRSIELQQARIKDPNYLVSSVEEAYLYDEDALNDFNRNEYQKLNKRVDILTGKYIISLWPQGDATSIYSLLFSFFEAIQNDSDLRSYLISFGVSEFPNMMGLGGSKLPLIVVYPGETIMEGKQIAQHGKDVAQSVLQKIYNHFRDVKGLNHNLAPYLSVTSLIYYVQGFPEDRAKVSPPLNLKYYDKDTGYALYNSQTVSTRDKYGNLMPANYHLKIIT